jgi:mannose-6-phosphate isomerase
MGSGLEQIKPDCRERPWGSYDLSPWFKPQTKRIGEVWFPYGELLVKFIFTTESLSIQVHPDDAYAAEHAKGSRGKTEMWHILRADPGAQIAVGFREPVTREAAEQGARDGSIVDMLAWHNAGPGDTFYTPAGTVHAIGAGLALCEIQQNSDVTYRLYDWNRQPPRDLHLEDGFAVANLGTHPGRSIPDGEVLVRSPFFVTEKCTIDADCVWPRDSLMIVLDGQGQADGAAFSPGEAWKTPAGAVIRPRGAMTILRTYVET